MEGIAAPAQAQTPVRLNARARIDLPVPASHNGFVLVVEGEVNVGGDRVQGSQGQVLWLDYPLAPPDSIRYASMRRCRARVLAVSGGERVVAYGPFVMNSEEEIRQAYLDFHRGLFGGPTPGASRERETALPRAFDLVQAGADLLRRVVTLGTLKHVKVHIHRWETHLGCLHRIVDVGLAGHGSRSRTTPRGLKLRRLFFSSAQMKDSRS